MAAIKAFSDLEQSKKLAEILPLESADMCYQVGEDLDGYLTKTIYTPLMHTPYNDDYVPCWSLAALLGVMICPNLEEYIEGVWDLTAFTDNSLKTPIEIQDCKDPVDACVAMIEKLNELKML